MNASVRYAHSRDGTRIAYSVAGEGPVLVKLAGALASHLELYPQQSGVREYLDRLGHGRTLVRLDLRGSGMSDRDSSDFSQDALAEDIEAVLNELSIDRFDVLALGTRVVPALGLAIRRPSAVGRMVLCSPIIVPGHPGVLGLAESNWNLFLEVAIQKNTRRPIHAVREIVTFTRRCVDQGAYIAELHARQPDVHWAQAGLIDVPVLVLETAEMGLNKRGAMREFAALFPRGRFIELPPGSAPPPAGNPDAMIQAIEEFLGLVRDTAPSPDSVDPALTAREREVLSLLAAGRTQPEVAASLFISPATVSRHVTSIYTKIGAHRRAEAVAWAIRHGVAGP